MSKDVQGRSAHRLMAIGFFVGAPALLLAFAVLNGLQIFDNDFAAVEKTMQVAAFTRRLDAPAADGKPLDVSRIYLTGASRTLASANLQQHIVAAISATSGRLIETVSADLAASDSASEAGDIRLKATLDIDNNGLLQLLYILESGLPLLDIETLSVRRLPNEDGDGQAETLRVDMLVRGHWRQQTA